MDIGVPDQPEPIAELLPKLRAARGRISGENLAFAARDYVADERTLSSSLVAKIESGRRRPTVPVMRALARALDVDPNVFAEYRLAMLRRLFDEREVGLERAVANAAELAEALGEGGIPGPPRGELRRLLQDESPSDPNPSRQSKRQRTRARAPRPSRA